MTESELRERFEGLTLNPADFSHREHVRLAWHYLSSHPLLDVLRIFPESLKRFAASIGAHGLYHETVTWAFLILIHERMASGGERRGWDEFIRANEDLLDSRVLERYYAPEVLASDFAKRCFVIPPARI